MSWSSPTHLRELWKQDSTNKLTRYTPCPSFPASALTIESDDAVKLILVKLAHATPSQCLEGEGGTGGQRAEAGEQVERQVGAAALCLLGPRETDGGAQDGTSWVYRGDDVMGGKVVEVQELQANRHVLVFHTRKRYQSTWFACIFMLKLINPHHSK